MSATLVRLPCQIKDFDNDTIAPLYSEKGVVETTFSLAWLPKIQYKNILHLIEIIFDHRQIWCMDSLVYAYIVIFALERYALRYFFRHDNREIPRLKRITVDNLKINFNIRRTSHVIPEQWVVELGQNEYIGLTRNGPRIMTKIQWCHYTQLELLRWSRQTTNYFGTDKFVKSRIRMDYVDDELNKWMFDTKIIDLTHFSGMPVYRERFSCLQQDKNNKINRVLRLIRQFSVI